jgi:hypothetical protein
MTGVTFMNTEAQIEQQIRTAFLNQEWLGSIPVEEAISGAILYRRGLNAQDRAMFDTEMLTGRHSSPIDAARPFGGPSGHA